MFQTFENWVIENSMKIKNWKMKILNFKKAQGTFLTEEMVAIIMGLTLIIVAIFVFKTLP